ncbi:DNA transposase THAP9 [Rhinatrema bivittatum]|uniref:DNA transposase THAP9 n=1 Tax=Rhinatrema bivittatum TaxID=194408 RepID=UPI00112AF44C|nr:DNA transposase THAP9 [Rhinatrema bivittatum]XP_029471725.1 DNA transposase THAP9 [Rhinatrema bivittatum]
MPVSCAAFGCKSRYTLEAREKGITFHRFPKSNPILLEKWRIAVERATSTGELWMPSRYQRLCSLHFEEKCFDTTGQTKRLRDDVIPSIFNFPEHPQIKKGGRRGLKRHAPAAGSISLKGEECLEPEAAATAPCAGGIQTQLQDHLYSTPNIETLKRKLQASEEIRAQKVKELKNAKDREKRRGRTCPSVTGELSQRSLLGPELQGKMQPYADIPLDLFRKPESQYSLQQHYFALTLHLYGPKAYDYLKNEIKLPLPSSQRLRQWLKVEDDRPGINAVMLQALIQRKAENPQEYTRASLLLNTVALRPHLSFDPVSREMVGFIDLGKGAGTQELASEALLFLLVGVVGHWKAPIAYFLLKDATAEAQKQLVLHALRELCDSGFEVVAMALEGREVNKDMCTLLGCNFTKPTQLKTYFSLPGSKQKCYVIFDVRHELKLVGDMLEACRTIQSQYGQIQWQCIEDLRNMQKDVGLQTSRKLTPSQPPFFSLLKKVALAVQTLSPSLSKALWLLNGSEKFVDCMGTVSYIQILNRLFDTLSGRSPRVQGERICGQNLQYKLSVLQETKEYLLTLTSAEDRPSAESWRRRCLIGSLVNITSVTSLLPSLLLDQEYVVMYRFSLDHLRLFCESIRRSGGRQKPTALHFMSAVRRLLSRCGVKGGRQLSHGTSEDSRGFVHTLEDYTVPGPFQQEFPSPFEDNSIVLEGHEYASATLSLMLQDSAVYITGWVVQKALGQLGCDHCRWALVTEARPQDFRSAYHLLRLKHNGGLLIPSPGSVRTVLAAERALWHMLRVRRHGPKRITNRLRLQHQVLSEIGNRDVFDLREHVVLTESGIDNHHYQLLRLLSSSYYELRQPYLDRLERREQHTTHVKRILTQSRFSNETSACPAGWVPESYSCPRPFLSAHNL